MDNSSEDAVKLECGDYHYDPVRWAIVSGHTENFSNSSSAALWLKLNIGSFARGTLFRTKRVRDSVIIWEDHEIRKELG